LHHHIGGFHVTVWNHDWVRVWSCNLCSTQFLESSGRELEIQLAIAFAFRSSESNDVNDDEANDQPVLSTIFSSLSSPIKQAETADAFPSVPIAASGSLDADDGNDGDHNEDKHDDKNNDIEDHTDIDDDKDINNDGVPKHSEADVHDDPLSVDDTSSSNGASPPAPRSNDPVISSDDSAISQLA
jgi:hypothetical protein